MIADHFGKTHATDLSPLFINSVSPNFMPKQKMDKNTNNKCILSVHRLRLKLLVATYKDVWTLLVYTSVS